jgi:hypothetical protein
VTVIPARLHIFQKDIGIEGLTQMKNLSLNGRGSFIKKTKGELEPTPRVLLETKNQTILVWSSTLISFT